MSTMIETKDLRFAYPVEEGEEQVFALKGVDLAIEKGSFVVVLGHNGSGKSTLAKTFNTVLLPSGGKVYVEGMDTADEVEEYYEKLSQMRFGAEDESEDLLGMRC